MKNIAGKVEEGVDASDLLESTIRECSEWQELNEKESQEFIECLSVEPKKVIQVYFGLGGPTMWAELEIGRDGYPVGGTYNVTWWNSSDSVRMTELQAIQIWEAYGVEAHLEHQTLFRK